MSICSLVVYTRPDTMERVRAEIEKREGCEVPAAENGKIVVLMDHSSRYTMSQTIMDFNNIPGVVTVSLVFEYFEDGPTDAESGADVATEDIATAGQA